MCSLLNIEDIVQDGLGGIVHGVSRITVFILIYHLWYPVDLLRFGSGIYTSTASNKYVVQLSEILLILRDLEWQGVQLHG